MAENIVWILRKPGPNAQPERVPKDQVPGHYILACLHGHGLCYVDPTTIKLNTVPAHGEFPPEVKDRIRRIRDVLILAHPMSLEKWEHGFRCDLHPWGEIALWELVADGYKQFSAAYRGSTPNAKAARKAICAFLVALISRDKEGRFPQHQRVGKLMVGPDGMDQIQAWFESPANAELTTARRNELRKLIRPGALSGPSVVDVDALFDESGYGVNLSAQFNPRDLLESADIILGVDRNSDWEFLLYGGKKLEQVAASGNAEAATTLRVELDADTDDLERLVAIVGVVKGDCDYQPRRAA